MSVKTLQGVVAMLNGQYWGIVYEDGQIEEKGWVAELDKAIISHPLYCTKPTDMTWNPQNTNGHNREYDELKKATLVKVLKVTTISIVE